MSLFFPLLIALIFITCSLTTEARWTLERTLQWQKTVGYRAGNNFVPSTAVNELEMFQVETYDPTTIDRELGYASSMGFNVMRVFLHNLLWTQNSQDFLQRIEHFLSITEKYNMLVMFVLLDSCWNAYPKVGTQPEPIPGVHNSQWVQAPGTDILHNNEQFQLLKDYVVGVLSHFKDDRRIFAWDLWNEPNNSGYPETLIAPYLQQVFAWAREVETIQPLTTPIWDNSRILTFSLFQQLQMELSDVISFHNYDNSEQLTKLITNIQQHVHNRPIVCTEYMARTHNSTFEPHLQILADHNVHAINWGLVSGRTQTIYPWETTAVPATEPPEIWFRDFVNPNGTPFNESEITFIQSILIKSKN